MTAQQTRPRLENGDVMTRDDIAAALAMDRTAVLAALKAGD